MSRYIEVIVSPGTYDENGRNWRLTAHNLTRTRWSDPIAAVRTALSYVAKGMSVVLHPNFNEPHLDPDGGIAYREWRSFDGELFQEIHFLCGNVMKLGGKTVSMVRLNEELILPTPPTD